MNVLQRQTTAGDRRASVRTFELVSVVRERASRLRVLSLDCFDTLLWRDTATPIDVFYDLQNDPAFARLGFNAKLRVTAETLARQSKRIVAGRSEVSLAEIYRAAFPALDDAELHALAEAELAAEIRHCYAHPTTVELIRAMKAKGLRVVIVSDTYFDEARLRRLLEATLPDGAYACIERVFCSSEHGLSKGDGLFRHVLPKLGVKPKVVLHVGDNEIADLVAPRAAGLDALHLVHDDEPIQQLARLRATATCALDPTVRDRAPLAAPFRGVFASCRPRAGGAELLGYAAAGPIFYAFARFVLDEIAKLTAEGKRVKPLFLMRDGFLPQRACESIAGGPVGHAVSISRFAALAASLRSAADVDHYLAHWGCSGRFAAMARQLQLPETMAREIVAAAERAKDGNAEFVARARRPEVVEAILAGSAAYRQRLLRYLRAAADVREGDTLVFVDLGYEGTAQRQLQPVLRDELGVDVIGRYLVAARIPGWETSRRGLLDPSRCDDRVILALVKHIALVETLSTSDAGSVVDYTEDGAAVLGERTIDAEQYERVKPVQAACVAFAKDAHDFFARTGRPPTLEALRVAALGELGRLLFLPSESEVDYLKGFRLDMNLATRDAFQLFDLEKGLTGLRRRGLFFMEDDYKSLRMNYPIELRAAGLELSLSLLVQQRYGLEFNYYDTSLRREPLNVMIAHGERGVESSVVSLAAQPTYDGYFSLLVPVGRGEIQLGLMFGERYTWVQLESVELVRTSALMQHTESQHTEDVGAVAEGIVERAPGLLECAPDGFLFIAPGTRGGDDRFVCRVVFRPIARREPAAAPRNA